MGDDSSSRENGRFRFKEWLRGGFWQGRSGNTRQPPRSMARDPERSDEENEELDDDTAPYLSNDPRTVKDLRKDDSRGGTNWLVCAGCKRFIGSEAYLSCMGTFFHNKCFCCRACGHPITETEFSLSESKETYHKSCFKELTHPKCEVCYQFIPLNKVGLIEYRIHPFWLQKYCPLHELDNTSRCCSCERMEPWNASYITLRDGRKLCWECKESAVMDTGESLVLYHAIRDFFEGLNMKLDQEIPFLMVDRQALDEAVAGEGQRSMSQTKGITLSEEWTVPSTAKKRYVGQRQQLQTSIKKCEVTAILVLGSLPRLGLGAAIAHQLMYAWLRLKGYSYIDPGANDGICSYLSRLWIESEIMSTTSSTKKGKRSNFEKKLGEFLVYNLAADTLNGREHRAANAAVNKYGLRSTLEHIRMTGMLPPE